VGEAGGTVRGGKGTGTGKSTGMRAGGASGSSVGRKGGNHPGEEEERGGSNQKEEEEEECELSPVDRIWPLPSVELRDQEQQGVLQGLLHTCPSVIKHYLCSFVFPERMRHQGLKLAANGAARERANRRTSEQERETE
jgi:hypothetical protein